jgi:hypothetical protein
MIAHTRPARARRALLATAALTAGLISGPSNAQGDPGPPLAELGTVTVPATANIFGAGHSTPPDPGGGGAGTLPVAIDLPPIAAGQSLTFSDVTGALSCIGADMYGPDGSGATGVTNIGSYGGISSATIPAGGCALSLVGVFTDGSEPLPPEPDEQWDFSTAGVGTAFASFSPHLRRVFFIGDGLTGTGTGQQQQFTVPGTATKLFLGFMDAQNLNAAPGWYGDNSGSASATVTAIASPTLNQVDAGTFIKVLYREGSALFCTTGFALTREGSRYESGAKHCITGKDGESDNSKIAAHQPMDVRTSDGRYLLASGIDCSPPQPFDCLLPTVKKGQTGDMFAWRSPLTYPSAMVKTGQGLLPVVGQKTPKQVAGKRVCHYGSGSAAAGNPERCDNSAPAQCARCQSNTAVIEAYGTEGDSGGPVYTYALRNGVPYGVYAVGITIEASLEATKYIPIRVVQRRLKATLLTSTG